MTSWDIVFFKRDNTSEYVPTSWAVDANKHKYLWPKKMSESQIKKLRDRCLEPSVYIEYEEWEGTCKATVYTLEDAQRLALKAEYTSNLSSSPETTGEVAAEEKNLSDEASDLSDDNLELWRHNLKRKAELANKPTKKSCTPSPSIAGSQTATPSGTNKECSSISLQKNLNRTVFEHTLASSPVLSCSQIARNNNEGTADIKSDIKKITKALAGIKYDISEIKNDISSMKITLNQLSDNKSVSTRCLDYKLPLETVEQLDELERKIHNSPDELQNLVKVFCHVGGETIKKNVQFIMKKLMNRELSLRYSARGKKQKKDFSKLNIYKAVLEAVHNSFPTATDLQITQCIGIALATAGDRDGGRKHRAEKKNEGNDADE